MANRHGQIFVIDRFSIYPRSPLPAPNITRSSNTK
jgi:hypothetical protein